MAAALGLAAASAAAADAVSPEELRTATAVLLRLNPQLLEGSALSEEAAAFRSAGVALFRRAVLHERFGEADAVAHFKQSAKYKGMLTKLQRLEEEIRAEHDKRVSAAAACGINKKREERMKGIEAAAKVTHQERLAAAGGSGAPLLLEADAVAETGEAADKAVGEEVAVGAHKVDGGEVDGGAIDANDAKEAKESVDAKEGATNEIVTDEEAAFTARLEETSSLPVGSFKRHCGVCNSPYDDIHHFYHQLCPPCAELNYEKRHQTADMAGMVCVVTGGRVRIGYQIVLKLLRAGAFVLTTTRYPADAVQRYSREPDFADWCERLEVMGPVELSDIRLVEQFCDDLLSRFPRIHVLINNAAQTLTRSTGWYLRMDNLECEASAALPPKLKAMVALPNHPDRPHLANGANGPDGPNGPSLIETGAGAGASVVAGAGIDLDLDLDSGGAGGVGISVAASSSDNVASSPPPPPPSQTVTTTAASTATSTSAMSMPWLSVSELATELESFPAGKLDESEQPLDLSASNSWSRKLGEVPTTELLHTMAANAVAPFVLCGRLRPALAPPRVTKSGEAVDDVAGDEAAEGDEEEEGGTKAEIRARAKARAKERGRRRAEQRAAAEAAAAAEAEVEAGAGIESGGGGAGARSKREYEELWGHIINVSALEGKFSVGKKGSGHPHTNMAKAALNMLTCTSANGLFQDHILINAVDTGWVTDMAPLGQGAKASTHQTHINTPLDEVDGAARVLDPIFAHLNDSSKVPKGRFFKDYHVSFW